jgi:curved DNA-binding protein CbpA
VTAARPQRRRINPFEVLGVSSMASPEELTKAYRTLAKKYHPDKYQERSDKVRRAAEQRMAELNEAYKMARERVRRGEDGGDGARGAPWMGGDVGAWSRTARRGGETSAARAARIRASREAAERAAQAHESQARTFQRIRLEARKNARYGEAMARSKASLLGKVPSSLYGAGQAAHTNELQCRSCRVIQRLPADWQQRLDDTAYFCSGCNGVLLNR